MPDVICNTTPVHYLHQIGCLHLLSQLYQQVIVPQAVVDELRQGELRGIDVPSLSELEWISVRTVSSGDLRRVPARLDAGEREVLALALGKADPLLILDDAAARNQARALGIRFTGTVGVLMKAKQTGLIAAIGPNAARPQPSRLGLRPDPVGTESQPTNMRAPCAHVTTEDSKLDQLDRAGFYLRPEVRARVLDLIGEGQ